METNLTDDSFALLLCSTKNAECRLEGQKIYSALRIYIFYLSKSTHVDNQLIDDHWVSFTFLNQ